MFCSIKHTIGKCLNHKTLTYSINEEDGINENRYKKLVKSINQDKQGLKEVNSTTKLQCNAKKYQTLEDESFGWKGAKSGKTISEDPCLLAR